MKTIYESIIEHANQKIRVPVVQIMNEYGRESIREYLRNEWALLNDKGELSYNLYCLNCKLLDRAMASTGDAMESRRGKWVTRFRKNLKDEGVTITDQQLGRVGDIIAAHTDQLGPWFVDFTDELNWNPGNFGDKGSCFWGCHTADRDAMELYHAFAFRTYRNDSYDEGTGRAWVCKPKDLDDIVVMFNAYGKDLTRMTHIFTRLFESENTPIYSQSTYLFNPGGHQIYINGGGLCVAFSHNEDAIKSCSLNRIALGYVSTFGKYAYRYNYGKDPRCNNCKEEVRPTLENPMIDRATARLTDLLTGERKDRKILMLCEKCRTNAVEDIQFCQLCGCYHPNNNFIKDSKGHSICPEGTLYALICSRGHVEFPRINRMVNNYYGSNYMALTSPAKYLEYLREQGIVCPHHQNHYEYDGISHWNRVDTIPYVMARGPYCHDCARIIKQNYLDGHRYGIKRVRSILNDYGVGKEYVAEGVDLA